MLILGYTSNTLKLTNILYIKSLNSAPLSSLILPTNEFILEECAFNLPLLISPKVNLIIWSSCLFPQIISSPRIIIGRLVNDNSLLNLHGYTSSFLNGSGGTRKSSLCLNAIESIIKPTIFSLKLASYALINSIISIILAT